MLVKKKQLLGEGQSQLVKEFGVIKLLAEDVSEEKAIKLHYLSHGDYLYSFIPTRNPIRKGNIFRRSNHGSML